MLHTNRSVRHLQTSIEEFYGLLCNLWKNIIGGFFLVVQFGPCACKQQSGCEGMPVEAGQHYQKKTYPKMLKIKTFHTTKMLHIDYTKVRAVIAGVHAPVTNNGLVAQNQTRNSPSSSAFISMKGIWYAGLPIVVGLKKGMGWMYRLVLLPELCKSGPHNSFSESLCPPRRIPRWCVSKYDVHVPIFRKGR